MNSSRGPESDFEALPAEKSREQVDMPPAHWSRARVSLAVIAMLTLTGIVYRLYSRYVEGQAQIGIVQARALLDELAFEPNGPEWTAKANRAESLLRSITASSRQRTIQLLIAAVRCSRGARIRPESVATDCQTLDQSIAALLFFRGGEVALADKLATLTLNKGDERPRALRAATIVTYHLGRDEEVVQHATEWTQLAPEEVLAWQYLAYVAEDRGFWDEAITALKNQISRTVGSASEPRRRLIGHLIQVGDSAEARRQLEILMADEKLNKNETALLEARLLFLEGQLDAAGRILSETEFTSEDRIEASLLRARVSLERGETTEAVLLLRNCVRDAPANQDAHYLLGQALARIGEVAEAKQHLELHRQLLDLKVRINGLERQAGQQPTNIEVRQLLARLYRQIGLTQQAELWEEAVNAARQGRSH